MDILNELLRRIKNKLGILTENIKKNQTEPKNTITEIKNTLEGINSSLDDTEERISEREDRVVEITREEK